MTDHSGATETPEHSRPAGADERSLHHTYTRTDLAGERDPVFAGAVRGDVSPEHGVLLRRPRPLLHACLVAARRPPHLQFTPSELDLLPSFGSPLACQLARSLGACTAMVSAAAAGAGLIVGW
jgi:hypothetical protein